VQIAGREVQITNPDKVFFPVAGYTKGDLVDYYLAVAEGALCGVSNRPMALKRFVQGADGEAFFQKRAPTNRPPWIETAVLSFPSGRTAEEIVVRDAAQLAWVVNLGCIDLNPHPVRSDDLDHPDELRIDLDPMPGVPWSQVREVALTAKGVLDDMGLTGWPKTSGSRGMHIYCRIGRRWPSRVRSSGGRPRSRPPSGGRRSATASSSTTTRMPRTAPSPLPIRFGRHPTLGSRHPSAGTRCPTASPRLSRWRRCPPDSPPSAIPEPGSMPRRGRSKPCWSLRHARRRPGCRTRPGLRTIHVSRVRRRGSNPHAPGEAPAPFRPRPLADQRVAGRDRPRPDGEGGAGGAGALEVAPPGGGAPPRTRRRPGRRNARPELGMVSNPGQPDACPGRDAPISGAARGRLRPLGRLPRPVLTARPRSQDGRLSFTTGLRFPFKASSYAAQSTPYAATRPSGLGWRSATSKRFVYA